MGESLREFWTVIFGLFYFKTTPFMLHVVDIPLYLQEAKINLPSIILNFLTGEVFIISNHGSISLSFICFGRKKFVLSSCLDAFKPGDLFKQSTVWTIVGF